MAGDYVMVQCATPRKPEVLRLAALLEIAPAHAFGLCVIAWMWFDEQTEDGRALGATDVMLDAVVCRAGFSQALREVGWLQVREGSLVVPNFDRLMGESAKKRAKNTVRQQRSRGAKSVAQVSRSVRDKSATKEEKRREESISLSLAAAEASEIPAVHAPTLKTWRIPKGIPPPVAEALDRWQAFRVSVDGRPMPDMQLEASWLEMSRKGWGLPQVEASVEFSIRVGAKNLLDPANDRETRQSRAAPPAKKSKYAPVEM